MAKQKRVRLAVRALQAAEMLGVTPMTISRLCRAGELEWYSLTGAARSPRRIYVDSIVSFAKKKQGREIDPASLRQ